MFLKIDEVDIVTFLTPLKKIIVDSCQSLGNLFRLHILLIEESAHASMLG